MSKKGSFERREKKIMNGSFAFPTAKLVGPC
jgi:hypothetical protein